METIIPSGRILCCVTNDLNYDQRMIRICRSLSSAGYSVALIGRKKRNSPPLSVRTFEQYRISCPFYKGFLFYAFFNLQLFWKLLFTPCNIICAVDLDTLPATLSAAKLKRVPLVYDAHEYFTEVPEVVHRPLVKSVWALIARFGIPKTDLAYTVGAALAEIFEKRYGKHFGVIRNLPLRKAQIVEKAPKQPYDILLYQGMLNEGRGLECIIKALSYLPDTVKLWLAGEGDLSASLRKQVREAGLESRVHFLGLLPPEALDHITAQATLGLNLLENKGLSYYYSLANKAFDYIQAGVPSLQMAFPEYLSLQEQWDVFHLTNTLDPATLAAEIRYLLSNPQRLQQMRNNCRNAAQTLHWGQEEILLLQYYRKLSEGK